MANALDAVKETADIVTGGARGAGVVELVDRLLGRTPTRCSPPPRHSSRSAPTSAASRSPSAPDVEGVLIAGSSGIGKSTLATAILERLAERGYQFCVLDPEGDYDNLEGAVDLGDAKRVPAVHEVLDLLAKPETQLVVNMLGLAVEDRPRLLRRAAAADRQPAGTRPAGRTGS